jgi:hypothetical protein
MLVVMFSFAVAVSIIAALDVSPRIAAEVHRLPLSSRSRMLFHVHNKQNACCLL